MMTQKINNFRAQRQRIVEDPSLTAYEQLLMFLILKEEIEQAIASCLQKTVGFVDVEHQCYIRKLAELMEHITSDDARQAFLQAKFEQPVLLKAQKKFIEIDQIFDIEEKLRCLFTEITNVQISINIYHSMLTFDAMMGITASEKDIQTIKQEKEKTLKILEFILNALSTEVSKFDLDDAMDKTHQMMYQGFHEIEHTISQCVKYLGYCQQHLDNYQSMPIYDDFISKVLKLQKYLKTHLTQLEDIQKISHITQKKVIDILNFTDLAKQEQALASLEAQWLDERNARSGLILQNWYNAQITVVKHLRHHVTTKRRYRKLADEIHQTDFKEKISKFLACWDKYLTVYPEDLKKRKKYLKRLADFLGNIKSFCVENHLEQTKIVMINFDLEKINLKLNDIEATLKIDYPFHYHKKILVHPLTKLDNPDFVRKIQYNIEKPKFKDDSNASKASSSADEIDHLLQMLEKIDWAKRSFHEEPMRGYVEYWLEYEKNLPFFTWLQVYTSRNKDDFEIVGLEHRKDAPQVQYHRHVTYTPLVDENGLLYFEAEEKRQPQVASTYFSSDCPYIITETGGYVLQSSDNPYWDLMADDNGREMRGTMGIINGSVRWISNQYQQYSQNPFAELAVLRHLTHEHQVDLSKVGVKLYVHYDTEENADLGYEQAYYFDNALQVLEFFEHENIDLTSLDEWEISQIMAKLSQNVLPKEISTKIWALDREFNTNGHY